MERLTHRATTDGLYGDTMHLLTQEEHLVTVCFDGNPEDTARMTVKQYDGLTEGDCWESVGFTELQ